MDNYTASVIIGGLIREVTDDMEATADKDRKRVLSDRRRVLLIAGYLACDGDLIDEDPNS